MTSNIISGLDADPLPADRSHEIYTMTFELSLVEAMRFEYRSLIGPTCSIDD